MANVALGAHRKEKEKTAYIDQAQCLRERLLQQLHELRVQEFRVDLPHTRDAGVRRRRGRYVRANSRYSVLGVAPGVLPGLIMSQRVLGRHGVSGTRMTSLGRRRHPGSSVKTTWVARDCYQVCRAIVRDVGVSFADVGALYTCVKKHRDGTVLGWSKSGQWKCARSMDVSHRVRSVFLQFNDRSHNLNS